MELTLIARLIFIALFLAAAFSLAVVPSAQLPTAFIKRSRKPLYRPSPGISNLFARIRAGNESRTLKLQFMK
jgi:hypothetical protein